MLGFGKFRVKEFDVHLDATGKPSVIDVEERPAFASAYIDVTQLPYEADIFFAFVDDNEKPYVSYVLHRGKEYAVTPGTLLPNVKLRIFQRNPAKIDVSLPVKVVYLK